MSNCNFQGRKNQSKNINLLSLCGFQKVARGVARVLGLAGKGGWAAGRMEPARYFKKRIPIKPPSVKLIPGMKKPKHSATWVMGADNTGTNVRKIPFFNDRQAGKVARGGNSNQLKDNLLKKDVDKPKSNSPNKGKPDPKKTKKINPFKQILKKPITGLRKGAKGVKRGVRFPKVKKGFFPKLSALFKSLGAFVYVVIAVLVVLAVFLCKIFLCCLIAKLNAARRPRDRGIEMQYLIY